MAEIFQGVKTIFKGATGTGAGVSKLAEGATGIASKSFNIVGTIFTDIGKIVGGSQLRRSKRTNGRKINYFPKSPRRQRRTEMKE